MSDHHEVSTAAISPSESADRLGRVHGVRELQAAILALLLPAGSRRALRAWQIETTETPGAQTVRANVAALPGAARLPWLEELVSRMATQPIGDRQALLQSTRRIMGARGVARPIDRLHWLTMRRGLGEGVPLAARAEANAEVAEWLESDVLAVAVYTAFLSRMVPAEEVDSDAGRAWYDAVMSAWQPFAEVPPWEPPNAEAMVEALARMQTLSWMQRPVIVRAWVTTAQSQLRGIRLADLSADALRLSCTLLDSPMPPDLERHHVAVPHGARSR